MAPLVLIIKSTIDNVEISNIIIIFAVQKIVQLKEKKVNGLLENKNQTSKPFGT